jgi:hypothetical protein
MTINEAKEILQLYRPGTEDADDPQVAEALALAESNPELSLWLEMHIACQEAMRAKLRQISPPAGLKEQILSEHAASPRAVPRPPVLSYAVAALAILLLGALVFVWLPRRSPTSANSLAMFQREMVSIALRSYPMDLHTNNASGIRAYLTQKSAPANFTLPAGLQKTPVVGCAVELWQGASVSLVCFRTGKPLAPGSEADLWLFVADRASVKNLAATTTTQFAKISKVITATWSQGDKLYLLGGFGNEADLKPYL